MPYEGSETLVFKSNAGEIDSIFLLKKDTLKAYPETQKLNGIKYETVSIFCKHSDSNMPDSENRYLNYIFFKVEKDEDSRAAISIRLLAKDAKFYRLSSIKIDSLNNEKMYLL